MGSQPVVTRSRSSAAGGEPIGNPAKRRPVGAGTAPALPAGVTHRLVVTKQGRTVVFELHGLVDAGALASLRAALDFAREGGAGARVVLKAGAEVERSSLGALRALEAELVAESPYLAAWIQGTGTK